MALLAWQVGASVRVLCSQKIGSYQLGVSGTLKPGWSEQERCEHRSSWTRKRRSSSSRASPGFRWLGSVARAGISEATYFNWKKRYGGMMPSEMKRLKELEDENTRLKRIVADLSLDKEMLQDVLKRKT